MDFLNRSGANDSRHRWVEHQYVFGRAACGGLALLAPLCSAREARNAVSAHAGHDPSRSEISVGSSSLPIKDPCARCVARVGAICSCHDRVSSMTGLWDNMDQSKDFDVLVLASITSGTPLTDSYAELHEAVEFILGHIIWRHEYGASREVAAKLICARYPDLPADTAETPSAVVAELSKRYGATLRMPMGNLQRTASPLQTLMDIYVAQGVRCTRAVGGCR